MIRRGTHAFFRCFRIDHVTNNPLIKKKLSTENTADMVITL